MEVSFMDLIKIIVKRWWIILITLVIGTSSAFLIANSKKSSYVAQASFLAEIVGKDSDYTFGDLNMINASNGTIKTIMTADQVYDDIAEYLNENGYSITRDALKSKFSFAQSDAESLIFHVRCTDGNKDNSVLLLELFAEYATERVDDKMAPFNIKLGMVEEAHYVSTITPDVLFNTLLGAFIGLVAGLLAVFIVNGLDNRIDDVKELAERHDIPVVGIIPTETATKGDE